MFIYVFTVCLKDVILYVVLVVIYIGYCLKTKLFAGVICAGYIRCRFLTVFHEMV